MAGREKDKSTTNQGRIALDPGLITDWGRGRPLLDAPLPQASGEDSGFPAILETSETIEVYDNDGLISRINNVQERDPNRAALRGMIDRYPLAARSMHLDSIYEITPNPVWSPTDIRPRRVEQSQNQADDIIELVLCDVD